MKSLNYLFNVKYAGIVGLCSSLLIGLPVMAQQTSDRQMISSLPCPQWSNQVPGESLLNLYVGCSPNKTLENSLIAQAVTPPLPEETTPAVANVTPKQGSVNIQLTNTTNTIVTYEIIGHTNQRQLTGGQNVDLKDIPLPVTITLLRPDNGFLKVIPISSESDILKVTLQEDPSFDDTQGVIRIQENGQVFLN